MKTEDRAVVGVDTGGTFTDLVYQDGRQRGVYKLLSTPDDPARAVLEGLAHIFGGRRLRRITYGTTAATNAMLERRGARTALITTAGFEDLLEIGRQARPALYELEPRKPSPLLPRSLCHGVNERVLHDGTVARALDGKELEKLARRLQRLGVESVAVCLLHAATNPTHEKRIGQLLAGLGIPLTLSHEICPEPGEYERASTSVANAYVQPMLESHLAGLAREIAPARLWVMQSNGGAIGIDIACREPVRTMLSGPAGGVAAAWSCAQRAGLDRIVTFDMGGTSTDVALIDGSIPRRAVTVVGGIPLRSPSVDIHTVGAGGGSIASLDAGGSLKVGPQSAGADPGPACYGRGNHPTVTDANVILGRLMPEFFLGGGMKLDSGRARRALKGLAHRMGASGPEQAAEGVVRVVEGAMERAMRVITVERGQDPRSCTLVAFGGAAPLHACGLAAVLDIPAILVPPDPGLLSAWGVLTGPVVRDRSLALATTSVRIAELRSMAAGIAERAVAEVEQEGISRRRIQVQKFVRLRYLGQSLQLELALTAGLRAAFHATHQRLFHHASPDKPVEVVGIRVTASAMVAPPPPRTRKVASGSRRHPVPLKTMRVYLAGGWRRLPLYGREQLGKDGRVVGPALIREYSSTVLVARGWTSRVDAQGNLRLEPDRHRCATGNPRRGSKGGA